MAKATHASDATAAHRRRISGMTRPLMNGVPPSASVSRSTVLAWAVVAFQPLEQRHADFRVGRNRRQGDVSALAFAPQATAKTLLSHRHVRFCDGKNFAVHTADAAGSNPCDARLRAAAIGGGSLQWMFLRRSSESCVRKTLTLDARPSE